MELHFVECNLTLETKDKDEVEMMRYLEKI